MKKIFFIFLIIFLMCGCNSNNKTISNFSLMNYNEFKDIVINEVKSLEIIKYTVDGKEEELIDNYDDIVKKYNYLNNFKIGDKTNITCEDNTVIYNFKQNDKIISINIECGDILVINDDRYELIKGE